jgi:hypothetical protein
MPKILFSANLIAPIPALGADFGAEKWTKHGKTRIYKMKKG